MNRYIVSTLDHEVIGSKNSAYIYSKLGRLLLFGEILEPSPLEWDGTQVALDEGTLSIQKSAIPARILEFINERSNLVASLFRQISPAQKEKIQSSMQQDFNKLSSSQLAQAMEADIKLCGGEAFDITKSEYEKNE